MTFLLHYPEAHADYRVVCCSKEGEIICFTEDGRVHDKSPYNALFMADKPKVKKTVYLNIYKDLILAHHTEEEAKTYVWRTIADHVAVPATYEVEE